MKGVDDVPESVHRAVVFGIVLYFALLVYVMVSNDPTAMYAREFLFGVIAIGVGTVLYLQNNGGLSAILGAAICLIAGGVVQFFYLFTRVPAFDLATSLLVFVGIALYIYAVWGAE